MDYTKNNFICNIFSDRGKNKEFRQGLSNLGQNLVTACRHLGDPIGNEKALSEALALAVEAQQRLPFLTAFLKEYYGDLQVSYDVEDPAPTCLRRIAQKFMHELAPPSDFLSFQLWRTEMLTLLFDLEKFSSFFNREHKFDMSVIEGLCSVPEDFR